MGIFIVSYIIPFLLAVLGRPLIGHFLVAWFGWLITAAGILWVIISILRSIQTVKGGWQGVIDGPAEQEEPLEPGIHWVWLGIQRLRRFRIGEAAYVLPVPMSRKLAFVGFTGTLKKATAYVTVTDPIRASRCQNWMFSIESAVADAVGEWLQSDDYRNELPDRNGEELEFFSQNAANLATGWGLKCKVSLHVEPGN